MGLHWIQSSLLLHSLVSCVCRCICVCVVYTYLSTQVCIFTWYLCVYLLMYTHRHTHIDTVVCWKQMFTSLPNSTISAITLVTCNGPWWEYSYHRNWQLSQIMAFFSLADWLLNIFSTPLVSSLSREIHGGSRKWDRKIFSK